LGPEAFTWQVLFEHHPFNNPNHHTHPFFPPTSGIAGGTFTIPTSGETDPDVWYRIFFTARDSYGLEQTIFRDILPRHAQVSLATTPVPLKVRLDAIPKNTPYQFWSVVNMRRNIGVDTPQVLNGMTYDFYSWSDGGERFHNISAPPTATSYVANFWKRPAYGTVTASPNPVRVTDGTGAGVTTLFWASGETKIVEVHLGAPAGELIARTGPGSFSQVTNKIIREGMKFYLQDVSDNQPLTSAFTLDSVTLHVTGASTASITADPNPFPTDSNGLGQTTLAWTSFVAQRVEIHINAPNGPAFAGGDPGTFSMPTGHWVTDGMTFYLQDVSNGLPLTAANTLAAVTMEALTRPPAGSITARPNPFAPDAEGLGETTLAWTSYGTTAVEIHVGAPNGNAFVSSGPGSFSARTGHWLQDGQTFYLQDVSHGKPLISANTLATVTVHASP
jgi:hypothetical protein